MLGALVFLIGVIYGYSNPGKEDRIGLLKKGGGIGLILGMAIAVLLTLVGLLSRVFFFGIVGIGAGFGILLSTVYFTVLFILGTIVGDFIEGMKS